MKNKESKEEHKGSTCDGTCTTNLATKEYQSNDVGDVDGDNINDDDVDEDDSIKGTVLQR